MITCPKCNGAGWADNDFTDMHACPVCHGKAVIKTSGPKTYSVLATYPDGKRAYVKFRNRTEWTRRTAKKHAREFTERHLVPTQIVEN